MSTSKSLVFYIKWPFIAASDTISTENLSFRFWILSSRRSIISQGVSFMNTLSFGSFTCRVRVSGAFYIRPIFMGKVLPFLLPSAFWLVSVISRFVADFRFRLWNSFVFGDAVVTFFEIKFISDFKFYVSLLYISYSAPFKMAILRSF